jgi:hypothetical protein
MSTTSSLNDLNDLKLKLASLMAHGSINFGTPDYEIANLIPEYTVENINVAFTEIIRENMEFDSLLEVDEDFFEGY